MSTAEAAATTDTWSAQLEQLRSRYKHVRAPILAALNILILSPNISLDDAKAQCAMHGVRITAASVSAARTLLSRMDAATAPKPAPISTPATGSAGEGSREPRRPRTADKGVDAEALVRGFIAKLQTHGNAETDRLREAMRRAIAVLQAAVGN
jgi:hypothetical protein